MKPWLRPLEAGRWDSRGHKRWASVKSVSGRRDERSLDKISVQGEGEQPVLGGRCGHNSRAQKIVF